MDESPGPSPGQRKRPLSPKTPASQRPRVAKKVKTGLTPHDMQKNATAGPSTQSKPSGVIQSRKSSRISRPTTKKLATRTQKRPVASDSDSDSDESFPSNILRKVPSNLKKRKLSSISKPSPSGEHKTRESKAKGKGKVVHLGAIELSSDSQDDPHIKPPKKRPKKNERIPLSPNIIDLCSDPEEALSSLKTPTRTRMEKNVVVILSSDDECHLPSPKLFASEKDLDNQDIPISQSPIEALAEPQGQEEPEVSTSMESNRIPPRDSPDETEIPIDCLQPSLNEALKNAKVKSGEAGDKVSCFTTSTSLRPLRMIQFTPEIPNPILHTPGFFSRAITNVKTAVLAAQKRAKRRKIEALLASSSTKHGTGKRISVQCIKLREPEVSTLAITHSSSIPILDDAVDQHRTTLVTYPAYTAPIPVETRESGAPAASKAMGCEFDQVSEGKFADVAGMEEQHITEPILEGTPIPFDVASEGPFPSIEEEAQDPQDKLARPVALNSITTASASPVLHSPFGHKPLSVDGLHNEASLDGSGLSLRRSASRQPDPPIPKELLNHVLTTPQFKVSWSVSEIPEKTRASAQCLIQALNDLKMSKKSINITTPPTAIISPHVGGGSNSLTDCNPISLNGSITSDPSEVESPPPITPSDSPTDESLVVPSTPTCKTVPVVDFDLKNLNFSWNSQYDDDDDTLSLSGEFMYPDADEVC